MQAQYIRVCSYCQHPREPLKHQRGANVGKLICTPCQRDQERPARRRYYRDPSRPSSYTQRYQRGKALLESLKRGPCTDCGGTFAPVAMQFDHRDPSTKQHTISTLASSNRVDAMLVEIAKCDLVCANCHAVRTQRQIDAGVLRMGRRQIPD